MTVEKNITWKKGKGKASPKILRFLGRVSSGEKGKGTEVSRKKINILKK